MDRTKHIYLGPRKPRRIVTFIFCAIQIHLRYLFTYLLTYLLTKLSRALKQHVKHAKLQPVKQKSR